MIPVPSGVRVWLAVGRTDMRKGMNGLALQVQQALGRDPHAGDLYVCRGARGELIKIIWHDGIGMSLYAKRLERGRFISYGLCQRARATAPLRLRPDGAGTDVRGLQWPGRQVYVDGRSGSYAGIGYPMMTDASEGYLGLAADISAMARPK